MKGTNCHLMRCSAYSRCLLGGAQARCRRKAARPAPFSMLCCPKASQPTVGDSGPLSFLALATSVKKKDACPLPSGLCEKPTALELAGSAWAGASSAWRLKFLGLGEVTQALELAAALGLGRA
jgi:hypothetical protein